MCSLTQIGIIVGLLSTSVQSLGLTLQRKSHILEDEKGPHEIRRPPYRRGRWQLGMGMFIAANLLGSSVQISTLPLPVLSTLQASGLVFNSICATLILNEPFTRWSLWGTLLVCTGAVLIAIFGAIPEPAHNLRELLDLLGRKPFIVWMSMQALLVLSIAISVDCLDHFTSMSLNSKFRFARGLAYGCISGILSAHSLLVAKSAVELIIKTIADGNNQFVHWQAWVLVLALITLALSQLYYLHRGLKLVSTSVLYPLVFCIYNIIAILDGLIYFKQTDMINPLRACLIALGTVILLAGVLALSWRLSDEQHPPGVGQSSLAPGLGLVEDTEDEEESLLGGDDLYSLHEEDDPLPATTYSTFNVASGESSPLTPTPRRKKTGRRWQERAEIWGELEDRDTPSPPVSRRRSSTMPDASESTSLLPHRRGASSGSGNQFPPLTPASEAGPSGESPSSRRPMGRRRRKSTGFPGFTARRRRKSQSSTPTLQEALGGIWKLKWWRSEGRPGSAVADDGASNPPGSSGSGSAWPMFRDEPPPGTGQGEGDPGAGGGRENGSGSGSHDRGRGGRPNDDSLV
ncbi:putative magnesium-dependent phosphatase [Colletotrichum spaethianum]|uniref:Magnesium-dependent phosphatase n=1 Tax=Colletotrichum spaethianum TaxID=700344 RepID=A0AA37PEI0_9PEZI|nr:putative magnesium-dependent phosphatase [Colletotrichum spaethianum]GKT50737.1 putative magnesium-dependent phosphatase [Colletotrichum spaethianum]